MKKETVSPKLFGPRLAITALGVLCFAAAILADSIPVVRSENQSSSPPSPKTLFQIYASDSLVTEAFELVDKAAADTIQWSSQDLQLLRELIRFRKQLEVEKAEATIDRAVELARQGDEKEALNLLTKLIQATDDLQVLANARSVQDEIIGCGFWCDLWKTIRGFKNKDYIVIPAVFLLLYWTLYLVNFKLFRGQFTRKWTVQVKEDKSKTQLGNHALTTLSSWTQGRAIISYGDFRQGSFHSGLDISLTHKKDSIDLTSAIESIPGGWSKFAGVLFAHWSKTARRHTSQLEVSILLDEVELFVIVAATVGKRFYSLREICKSDCSLEQKYRTIERGCFHMLYYILSILHGKSYEAAGDLYDGLQSLKEYAKSPEPSRLEESLEKLKKARQTSPDLLEAHLLEGIALDLDEQHDESERRLTYLLGTIEDRPGFDENPRLFDLRERALYSRAVSKHRKYDLASAKSAISDLDKLLKGKKKTSDQGLTAHAYVLRASIKAHEPIYDDYQWPELNTLDNFEGWKSKLFEAVDGDLSRGEKIVRSSKTGSLGEETRRELSFSISNAKGNLELNTEKSLSKSAAKVSSGDVNVEEQIKKLQAEHLDKAYKHFRFCEEYSPPRIETLMNIATTLLGQGKSSQAIEHCEKAIEMNPKYEYAYYRLFEAKVKESEDDPPQAELLGIYKRFTDNTGQTEPKIRGFVNLLNEHLDDWRERAQ